MKLEGMHHITMMTADARKNVAFYADVLGLRLVKQTVNFDAPEAYHLYFGDEQGSPGSILTWFEFADAGSGTAGAGMIHTIELGVASGDALDFWAERLTAKGYPSRRSDQRLRFTDYDGLAFELVVADDGNPPLRADHPEIPEQHAILGVEGARAYAPSHDVEDALLTATLGFRYLGDGKYLLEGHERHFHWTLEPATHRGIPGAGTVHHIAWHTPKADHLAWQQRVAQAGQHVTPVIDRDYFDAIYFREPRGVLFEIATTEPGFAVDEPADRLGEALQLPAKFEPVRPQLEQLLQPLVNPRTTQREQVTA